MSNVRHNFSSSSVSKHLQGVLVDVVNMAALTLEAEIKQTLSKSQSPSNKGQPPGTVTGTLKRSWQARKTSQVGDKILTTVGSDAVYARVLEFGHDYPGGQPFFKSKAIAKKQGNPIPGTDIAFAKKSSPFAARMKKTKPWTLAARPYVGPTVTDSAVLEKLETRTGKILSEGLRQLSGGPN